MVKEKGISLWNFDAAFSIYKFTNLSLALQIPQRGDSHSNMRVPTWKLTFKVSHFELSTSLSRDLCQILDCVFTPTKL